MTVLVAFATMLSAQTMREQADGIVKEHLQRDGVECNLLYVNTNAPTAEGIGITTSQEETFRAQYACWTYYLNESELSQYRYTVSVYGKTRVVYKVVKNSKK
jgi:hypothetical protein